MPRTSETYFDGVIAADAFRRRWKPGVASLNQKSGHRLYEFPFNVIGALGGILLRNVPAIQRRNVDLWLCRQMAAHPEIPDSTLPEKWRLLQTVSNRLRQETGVTPTLLFPTSHPNTEGSDAWLRFELFYRALEAAHQLLRTYPHPFSGRVPRCVLAVDPYALDSVSVPIGGIYSAWMAEVFLTVHRQPSKRLWFHRAYFHRHGIPARIGWRFLRFLKEGTPLVLAWSGGLPHNARLVYAAREFLCRLSPRSWPRPRLDLQLELLKILVEPSGSRWAPEDGQLAPEQLQKIQALLGSLGISTEEMGTLLADFQNEFAQTVPYRRRLWKILAERVVLQGKPILIQGIGHEDGPQIRWMAPWGLFARDGRLFRIVGEGAPEAMSADGEFGKEFVLSSGVKKP